MSALYVDTSALGRVLLGEPDAPAIAAALGDFASATASRLLAVELRRLALRHRATEEAARLLAPVALVPVDDETLAFAASIEPAAVGTLDAIHLATAARIHEAGLLGAILTYDRRLGQGARHHGIPVLAP